MLPLHRGAGGQGGAEDITSDRRQLNETGLTVMISDIPLKPIGILQCMC